MQKAQVCARARRLGADRRRKPLIDGTAVAEKGGNEIFWTVGLNKSPHPYQLDDLESKYDELQRIYPGNYGWYLLALDLAYP